MSIEFSARTRRQAHERFRSEVFDLLIVGGGITGAGAARDAASRGMKVALVERNDFAFGTSSRSSKLIHGGLRYLENFEFKLVFEALSERALLLKTAPHMVRPLKFFLPVYKGDANGRGILALGLWLYDVLALFRAPGFHKQLSRKKLLERIPFLKKEDLRGGFEYYDASMWDDVMVVEAVRDAARMGAAIANYTEAVEPLWEGERIAGFRVRADGSEFEVRAKRTMICAGPWLDSFGMKLSPAWREWLEPSKGVHLIFDRKRIPIPGAMVMSHPSDGRISFVIPRTDFGTGVVIVGTTDGPVGKDPTQASIEPEDVKYLMDLLDRYFPELRLTTSDILSAYVGVRPLTGKIIGRWEGRELKGVKGSGGGDGNLGGASLQKVSREHHIDRGPGDTTIVAGGKYTTHRRMAQEAVDFVLKDYTDPVGPSRTEGPMNAEAMPAAIEAARASARTLGAELPESLTERFGAGALEILKIARETGESDGPDGFPWLAAQLRYSIRHEMVERLEDFYLRRVPLYAARADHGLPWAEALSRVWAAELGRSEAERVAELGALRAELERRSAWRAKLPGASR